MAKHVEPIRAVVGGPLRTERAKRKARVLGRLGESLGGERAAYSNAFITRHVLAFFLLGFEIRGHHLKAGDNTMRVVAVAPEDLHLHL